MYYCANLVGLVLVTIAPGVKTAVNRITPAGAIFLHAWALTNCELRLVSALNLHMVNLCAAFVLYLASEMHMSIHLLLADVFIPMTIKLLVEGFYRKAYATTHQIRGYDRTIWRIFPIVVPTAFAPWARAASQDVARGQAAMQDGE